MANQRVGKKLLVATALGSGVVLVAAGCSSNSSSSSSASPTAASPTATATSAPPAPTGAVPGPPAGSTQTQAPKPVSGGATYTQYKTSAAPTAVTSYYDGALKAAGFTVTNNGSGGGGWGQYGGSGAQVGGNDGKTFVEVNAGGSKQGATYFEVCTGPSAAAVNSCQSGNHGSSSNS